MGVEARGGGDGLSGMGAVEDEVAACDEDFAWGGDCCTVG